MCSLYRIGTSLLIALLIFVIVPSQPVAAQSGYASTGFHNNNSPFISYSSNNGVSHWTYTNTPQYAAFALGGDVTYTTVEYASLDFRFSGSDVTFWYSRKFYSREIYVYIDGKWIDGFDTAIYSNNMVRQASRTWTVANSIAPHILHLTFKPNNFPGPLNMEVDGFSVNTPRQYIGTYDSNHQGITYSGNWIYSGNAPGAGNNSITYSNTCGGIARFTFQGDNIKFVYSRGPTYGLVNLLADGIFLTTIDLYSSTYQRQLVYQVDIPDIDSYTNLLPPAEGARIDIHTFEVHISCNKNAASSNTYVDIDSISVTKDIMSIPYVPQMQSLWCWATVAQMVGQYTTMNASYTNFQRQCQLVASLKGSPCPNVTGAIWEISTLLSNHYSTVSNSHWPIPNLSASDLRFYVLSKRPVIIRWEWGGINGAHFVIVHGIDDASGLFVVTIPYESGSTNPFRRTMSYSELVSGSAPGIAHYDWSGYIDMVYRSYGN